VLQLNEFYPEGELKDKGLKRAESQDQRDFRCKLQSLCDTESSAWWSGRTE